MDAFNDGCKDESFWNDYKHHALIEESSKNKIFSKIKRDSTCLNLEAYEQSKLDEETNNDLFKEFHYNKPNKYQKVVITEVDDETDPDTIFACKQLGHCMSLRDKWLAQHEKNIGQEGNIPTRESVLKMSQSGSALNSMLQLPEVEYIVLSRQASEMTTVYNYKMVNGVIEVFYANDMNQINICPVLSFHEFVDDFITVSGRIP
jgi:hypothetical protein